MKNYFYLFFFIISIKAFATHIVGGEIIYDYIGKDALGQEQYKIILKIYRDCGAGNAPFDSPSGVPAVITVREGNGTLVGSFDIGSPTIALIPPSINNPCINAPQGACVEEGIYTTTLTLPAKTGGYYIIYQRCCRNGSINNLIVPGNQGSTYFTKIPGPEEAPINSSPRFTKFPPIFLCANLDFTFDHSATDPDGDNLVYSLCPPFQGLGPGNSSIGVSSAAGPLPYPNVQYSSSYSGGYPIASSPAFSINPATGRLTGKPNLIGQFVVGVCIQEIRANQTINTHYRDFQFNILICIAEAISNMNNQLKLCEGSVVTFTNLSSASNGSPTALWDFGVANLSNDTSVLFNPTYTFPDTGKYTVTLIANPHKNCSDTSKKDFYIYPKLVTTFLPQALQCIKNNSFNFSSQGSYPIGTKFNWDFSNKAVPPTSNESNPSNITFKSGGLIYVTLNTNYSKCNYTYTDTVRVIELPPIPSLNWDTTVVIGQATPLNAFIDNNYTYKWGPVIDYLNCNTCAIPKPTSTTTTTITYSVVIEDLWHCSSAKSTYQIYVELKASIDVPTAFTPNGDGTNDILFPGGWGLKKLQYFKIFNRWGQLLFESNDLKIGWDGTYNSIAQNMDTYIYQVAVETYLKEEPILLKTGAFKLLR